MIYSVKGHQLAKMREIEDDIERGLDLTKKRKLDDRITETQFSDLNEKPLGSVPNILFWNDQQKQISILINKYAPTFTRNHNGLHGIICDFFATQQEQQLCCLAIT